MCKIRFNICLAVSLTFASLCFAENLNIERIGGVTTEWFNSVEINGDYAYCATKFGLAVMDVSDRDNPVVVTHLETPGNAQSVTIDGSLLYLCDGAGGLRIYSIEEPNMPSLVNVWDDAGLSIRLKIRDNLGFLAQGGGFTTIDLSQPESPRFLDCLQCVCVDMAISNDYAFISGSNILTVDISDPENLQRMARSDFRTEADVTVADDLLFAALAMYSLEDPFNIERLTPFHSQGSEHIVNDHYIFGSIMYGEYRGDNFFCFDFASHDSLEYVGSCEITVRGFTDMDYDDGFIYLVGEGSMTINDARDPENLHDITHYLSDNPASFRSIASLGQYIYTFDHEGRLWAIDFSNPDSPDVTQVIDWDAGHISQSTQSSLFVKDSILFSVQRFSGYIDGERISRNGLVTYSLADPGHPELMNVFNELRAFENIAFKGDYLFGCYREILYVISFEDVNSPEVVGEYEVGELGYYVYINGDQLALIFWDLQDHIQINGLKLYDVSNPQQLILNGQITLESTPAGVVITDDYAYIAYNRDAFCVVSINDPDNPEIICEINIGGFHAQRNITISNHVLYIPAGEIGAVAYSLDNPENPELIGYYNTANIASEVLINDNGMFIADGCNIGMYDISQFLGPWYLEVNEMVHDFDSVAVDSSAEWTLTIHNNGNLSREISSIALDSDVFFCKIEESFMLESHADTVLTVVFIPEADSLYHANLSITSDDRVLEITLSGQGYTPNAVANGNTEIPTEFALTGIYPNPFNSTTTIEYALPYASEVSLNLYNLSGQRIETLVNGRLQAGVHTATLNAGDMASGLYFVKLEGSRQSFTRKLMLVK